MYISYGRALLQLGIDNKDALLNAGAMPEKMVEGLVSGTLATGSSETEAKRPKLVDLDRVILEGDQEAKMKAETEAGSKGEADDADADETDEDGLALGDDDDQEGDQPEKDEDEFELAWEVLDIARLIYNDSASMNAEHKLALSEVFLDLGNVSMETESFQQAAGDFSKAIELKKELGRSGREMASAYFQYAVALEYDGRAKEALEPLTKAKDLLETRLKSLSQASTDDGKGKGRVDTEADKETEELSQLLPEIAAKLEELEHQIATGAPSQMDSSHIKATVNAAAVDAIQDLSGLVRKRKPESD